MTHADTGLAQDARRPIDATTSDFADAARAAQAPTATPRRGPRRWQAALVLGGALVMGLGAGLAAKQLLRDTRADAVEPLAGLLPASTAPWVASVSAAPISAGTSRAAPAAGAQRLQIRYWVVEGHRRAPAHAPTTLKSGDRFELALRAHENGTVRVLAVAPGSNTMSPLWDAPVRAGQDIRTPRFRLQGRNGVEQLFLQLRGADGSLRGQEIVRLVHL